MRKRIVRCTSGVLEIQTPKYIVIFNVIKDRRNEGPVTILNVMERRPRELAGSNTSLLRR